MPIIDITGHSDYDKCNILSIMYFPNHELKRKQFHLLNRVNGLLNNPDIEYVVSKSDLELLLESPSYNDFKKIT